MEASIENLIQLVELQLGRHNVGQNDRLLEDLEAESVDVVNLLVSVEEEMSVVINDADVAGVSTVGDLWRVIERAGGPGATADPE